MEQETIALVVDGVVVAQILATIIQRQELKTVDIEMEVKVEIEYK